MYGIIAVIAPASEVIERILNLVSITIGEQVAVSGEVRAKRAEKGI